MAAVRVKTFFLPKRFNTKNWMKFLAFLAKVTAIREFWSKMNVFLADFWMGVLAILPFQPVFACSLFEK